MLQEADNRYLLFNNEADDDEKATQVEQLMLLVKANVKKNGGGCFRHKISRELDQAKVKMVKEEMRKRRASVKPEVKEETPSKETESTAATRRSGHESGNSPENEEEANAADEVTHADQQAILRKQEVQALKNRGTVQSRLSKFAKAPSPKASLEKPPRRFRPRTPLGSFERTESPSGKSQSPRCNWELRKSTEDPQKIASDVASLDVSQQTSPEVAAAPGDKKQTAPDEAPTDLVQEWSSDDEEMEDFLNQFEEQIMTELTQTDDCPFTYEVPDKPGKSLAAKRRLMEDSIMRKVVSHPEELNDVQKEELDKAVQSVGTKFKEGMTKFAVKSIDQCRLM